MDEFKVIYIMNEAMLKLLEHKNANCDENLKIRKYLEDETIFFKIDKSKAYEILKKVGVKQEQLDEVYRKLTTSEVFYDLLNKGKLKADDDKLIIKYNTYNSGELFKKKK